MALHHQPPRPSAPASVSSALDQSSATATSYLPELGLLWTRASGSRGFAGHAGPSGGLDAAKGPATGHHFVRIPVGPLDRSPQGRWACVSITAPCRADPVPEAEAALAEAEGRATRRR